tara:strand:- start:1 stop:219 length:219 start_codon:yes stop_codon:yes gene_type:complete
MPISYTPLILVIKDIENNRLSSYNRVERENKIENKTIRINDPIKTNDKKENKIFQEKEKNFSFDDFFKIHLY